MNLKIIIQIALIISEFFVSEKCQADILTNTNLVSFGAGPKDMVVCYSNGVFYGTTPGGGPLGEGTIFKIMPDWTLTNIFLFNGSNGQLPYGGLMEGIDGNLYGTTEDGGQLDINGDQLGTVFQITPDGNFTSLYSFQGTNGFQPMARLIQGSDGYLYGTTFQGGTAYQPVYYPYNYGYGTVFKISTNGNFTLLASFNQTNGYHPMSGLLEVTNGIFYGTTSAGGPYGLGTIYQVTSAGVLTTIAVFDGANGSNPQAGLTRGRDRYLYGTTYGGGTLNSTSSTPQGTVYTLRNGVIKTIYTFSGLGDDGANPAAGVIQGIDGNLYGTTLIGGLFDFGIIYQVTEAGLFTTLHSFHAYFEPPRDGAFPWGTLIQTFDGNFYGITYGGGASGAGTFYRFPMPPTINSFETNTNSFSLHWHSVSNGIYQVQSTTNISIATWINLGGPVTATNTTMTTADSSLQDRTKLYRVVLLQ